MHEKHCLDSLRERGMIEQLTNETALTDLLAKPGISIYVGFDPTAASLHVGHLLPVMALAHLQRSQHRPIVLVGGATGMIGDPSGRSQERELLTPEAAAGNALAVRRQLSRFLSFDGKNAALMVDNADWIAPRSHLDWLRDVGKYFTVNYMLAKESVKRRMEDGLSYTEFSYLVLQAYDFLHLFEHFGCRVQAGGNDQWGNITAGIDLVRKVRGDEVYGMTFPLVTTTDGQKFGKSMGNAIWLDPDLTSPYRFYQYWIGSDDRDVERLLKLFTFLEVDRIEQLCREHLEAPQERLAQRTLAAEVTRTVHGQHELEKAERATRMLFQDRLTELTSSELEEVFDDVPSVTLGKSRLSEGLDLVTALVETGLVPAKAEARRMISARSVYINQTQQTEARQLTEDDLIDDLLMVVRLGKKRQHLVRFE